MNLHITHVVRLRNCSSLNRLPFCGANVTLRWAICPASLPKGLPDSIVPIRQHGVQGQHDSLLQRRSMHETQNDATISTYERGSE